MKKIVLFWVIAIFSFTYGCGTSPKQIHKVQDTSKQKADAITQNRNITNEKQIQKISSVSKNKTTTQLNNISGNQQVSPEKRGIKIIKKDDLSKFKSEKRVALIIGNSDYKISPLRNPVNDAYAMSETLKKLDFDVLIGTNLNQIKMKRMIEKFGSKIKNGGVGLFYYAGHGMQVRGRNYLIPVDANIKSENDVDIVSVRADEILVKMDDANNRLNIVILDACRNNPFARSFRSSSQGLATMDSPSGTLIAYATAPGSVASDGPGDNGLYTKELIKKMHIPDLKIEDMFKKIRTSVKAKTNDQQIPWESSSLEGDFYFCLSSVILDKKMKKVTAKQLRLKKEIEELELLEAKAKKANDARTKRQAELKKKAALAKLKAEELRQRQLIEEKRKMEEIEKERLRQKLVTEQKKREEEMRLGALEKEVIKKRKKLGSTTLSSLSPETTIAEMRDIEKKINNINASFKEEFAKGIKTITEQINKKFIETSQKKHDEFESEEEFKLNIFREKKNIENEQTMKFVELENKFEKNYNEAIGPFIESLKKLSGNEFTLTVQNLILELNQYDAVSNTYPVTIRSKQPIGGILVAVNANIPIPRQEARIFKQHFENNILRPELSGNFQSTDFFRIAQAYVVDDATNKKYDLFLSKFVDLGNGIVYDSITKLLWLKDANYVKPKNGCRLYRDKEVRMAWKDALLQTEKLLFAGLGGWRLPKESELERMFSVYHKQEPAPFINIRKSYIVLEKSNYAVDLGKRKAGRCGGGISLDFAIWPVRGR